MLCLTPIQTIQTFIQHNLLSTKSLSKRVTNNAPIGLIRNWLLTENPAKREVQKKINRYVSHIRPIKCLYGLQLVIQYRLFNRMK